MDEEYSEWEDRRGPHGRPGRTVLHRGIASLAVASAGYLLGFLVPFLIHSVGNGNSTSSAVVVFFPLGGIASLVLAVIAITVGRKVINAIDDIPVFRKEKIRTFVDLDKEKKLAATGIALGIISIVCNPLLGFLLFILIR